jgi:hypothetical protein
MSVNVYELSAKYDCRKSFGGKAQVIETVENDYTVLRLKSYETIVAEIIGGGKPRVFGLYSDTTTRHIVEFLKQNGFNVYGKKDVEKFLCER